MMERIDDPLLLAMAQVFEPVHNGMVIMDCDGCIRMMNLTARKILGQHVESVLDRHFKDILPGQWQEMKTILKDGQPQLSKQTTIGNRSVIVNRTPIILNEQMIGILSIFQDIADYEKVSVELEDYRMLVEELNVIINSSYDGLWICDAEGKVVRVNRASEKMSGVNEKDVIGRNMKDLVAEGVFDQSVTLEVIKKQISTTLIQKLSNGNQILVTGNPVRNSDGTIRLVVVNARDISELNRLHTELEQSRALNNQFRNEINRILKDQELGSEVIIRSAQMQKVFKAAMRVARVDSNVLITGESGVGKGLMAGLIHNASNRSDNSLIYVNCGAIPDSLIEAELFGYEKGAYTGARDTGKPGYFEMADDGSLLLDEIGELPLNVQVKLLRFLEGNEVTRIGATVSKKINTRVIAVTNRDLEAMVSNGTFRSDLYFRLKVVPLKIPPLRDRMEDIPPLIHHFLKQYNDKCDFNKVFSQNVIDTLCKYHFPGNVRELSNLIERLVVLTPGDLVRTEHLPSSIRNVEIYKFDLLPDKEWSLATIVNNMECRVIKQALETCGSQRKTAKRLGIHHATLSRKIRKYNL